MKMCGVQALFVIVLYVIQSSLLPLIAWHEISADLLLVAVVSVSFLRGSRAGVMFGFCAGLLQDLATGTFFGVDIFSKMVIGYGCGAFARHFFKEQYLLPVFSVLAASAANYFIVLMFMILLGYRFDWMEQISGLLLPMTAFNAVFALPVHFWTKKVYERFGAKS
ncbi:MAG: rod shape-determining protein MreD [Schwartzia sp.]|nr:rod shape-determining protein MreD [Schwartzia sp. (in: firmicutes)]